MIQTRSENFTSLNLSFTPRQQEQRELWEPPLSNEVLVLIKEDECGVCDNLQLSSEVVAHGHYHGRKHEKRLLKMLADKGGEVPKKKGCIVAENSAWHQSLMNPLRCELCKVDLNGPSTASLHYSGAKHQKRLNQVNNMAEFNMEVEDEKGQPAPMIDGTFGLSEADKEMMKEVGMMEEENPFFCKVCNINCQSQGPFEVHLMGVPHAKKVTNLNSS